MVNDTPRGAIIFGVLGIFLAALLFFGSIPMMIGGIALSVDHENAFLTGNSLSPGLQTLAPSTLNLYITLFVVMGIFLMLFSIALFIMCIGLLSDQNWARIGIIVMSIIGMVVLSVGFVLSLVDANRAFGFPFGKLLLYLLLLIVPVWQTSYLSLPRVRKLFE